MWILMKETYAGGIGCFNKGQKYDLPPGTVELIPKDCYKRTCPPWEEQTDKKAVALQNAQAAAAVAAEQEARIEQEIDSAMAQIEHLGHRVEAKKRQLEQARDDAIRLEKLAEKKAKAIAKAKAEAEAKAAAKAEAKAQAEAEVKAAAEAEAKANELVKPVRPQPVDVVEGQAQTGPDMAINKPGVFGKIISAVAGGPKDGKTEGPKQGQAGQ